VSLHVPILISDCLNVSSRKRDIYIYIYIYMPWIYLNGALHKLLPSVCVFLSLYRS
jgi:hypothetical protein